MKTLREMVGLNVHMSYNDSVYASSSGVRAKLQDLGVLHVRDYYQPSRQDQWTALTSLTGIGVLMGVGTEWIGNAANGVAGAKANIPNLEAFEGLNEYDLSGDASWRTVAGAHNDAVRRAVIKDSALLTKPVIAASIVFNVATATDDYLLNSTQGNLHPYPGGQWQTLADATADATLARKLTGALPLWATEWGYHTATGGYIAPGHPAVTETQQRDRMIAGLLTMQGAGWDRVYLYELLDLFSSDGMENRFGLYRNAGSAKPSATALKVWLSLIGDYLPATTSFGFSPPPAGFAMREFERNANDHLVAYWRETDAPARNIDVYMNDNAYHWQFARYKATTGSTGQGWASNSRAYGIPSVGTEPVLLLIRRQ